MTPLASDIAIAIGHRVRELRVERGLTQEALATRVGSHRPIVGRVERGRHSLSLDGLHAYARALGVDLFEIVLVLDDVADMHLGVIRCDAAATCSRAHLSRRRPYALRGGALRMSAGERYARRALNAWAKRCPTEAA